MPFAKKDLMDKLGVGYELGPYETYPWSYYDADIGQTCSAEVRMDPDGTEFEAEIQMMFDSPPAGTPPMAQVFWVRGKPSGMGEEWDIVDLKLRGEALDEDILNWQEKSCNFFQAVIQELQIETMPDIEELIDMHFHNRERLADQRQGGGGKSPKIRPGQLMNIKKGGF